MTRGNTPLRTWKRHSEAKLRRGREVLLDPGEEEFIFLILTNCCNRRERTRPCSASLYMMAIGVVSLRLPVCYAAQLYIGSQTMAQSANRMSTRGNWRSRWMTTMFLMNMRLLYCWVFTTTSETDFAGKRSRLSIKKRPKHQGWIMMMSSFPPHGFQPCLSRISFLFIHTMHLQTAFIVYDQTSSCKAAAY